MKSAFVILGYLVSSIVAATTESYTECGNTDYYGPSGVISSPNYPTNYSNNLDCNYYVYAPAGSSLSFIFISFNTESLYDSVTISCPDNSSFPQQGFSGYHFPGTVSIPWCSRGLVNFRTDESIVYTGFSLDYYVSTGGCGNTVYNNSYGHVTSPNYPNNYPDNLNCSNIIWAPQRSNFTLYFHQFEVVDSFNCTGDFLEISCPDNSQIVPHRICVDYMYNILYISGCSQLLLLFHTEDSHSFPGFDIEYNVTQDADCGEYSYHDSYGVIRSPNYPGYYYDNLNCDHYVFALSGSSLSFVFKSFHVENSDFVTISCPPKSIIPPQEFSGHTLPAPVSILDCREGKINFRTDNTNVSNGFVIDYYISGEGCGNTVYTGSNGNVNSPNWPDKYSYNQDCSNIIWATQQSTIVLNFRSFNLQDNCSCDWVEINCLDNPESGPTRYCGNYDDSYEVYIYRCSEVLLWFHSDDTFLYSGFNIEYTLYPVGACGDNSYNDPSGVISSPNYPGNYANYLLCDYTITFYASARSSISFIFTSFHVQEGFDFVTISCPANSSYPKYELTGDYTPGPLLIYECSQGLVNFHTDESVVSSGFSLKYHVSEGDCGNTLYYPSSGNVTSPNWPSNYGYDQSCSNIIYAWERSTFYLNVHVFILQSCCSCDWLEISCLDNSDYSPTRYCGAYAPVSTYIYNCSQVLLWFHSDGSSNDQGFNIEYSVFINADDSKVSNNGKTNAEENTPHNGKQNAAEKLRGNGTQNAEERRKRE